MSRRRLGIAFVGVVALIVPACDRRPASEPGEFRIASRSGSVLSSVPVELGAVVPAGAEVRTGPDASVRLTTGDGITADLAQNTSARVERGRIVVATGDVLARSSKSMRITLSAGAISATGTDATFRLDRELSLLVGVYEGNVRIDAPGGSAQIGALSEVPITGVTMDAARPLRISATSAWDVRFLGDALDLDRELDALRVGFTAQFGRRATSSAFFGRFIPLRSLDFIGPYLPRFESFDLLTGLLYSALDAIKTQRSLDDTFARLLGLRRRGATWGLIAAGERIGYSVALKGVFAAVARGTGEASAPQPATSPSPGTGGRPRRPAPTPTPSPSASASPSPRTSPSPSPSPSPDCGALALLLGNDCVLVS